MTLDKNKNLWVAHYHGACVSVFSKKRYQQEFFPNKFLENQIMFSFRNRLIKKH